MMLAKAAQCILTAGKESVVQFFRPLALLFQVKPERRIERNVNRSRGCLYGIVGQFEIPSPGSVSACQTEKGTAGVSQ